MDTTLVDFNDRVWERGDITFLYNPAADEELIVMDNKAKVRGSGTGRHVGSSRENLS